VAHQPVRRFVAGLFVSATVIAACGSSGATPTPAPSGPPALAPGTYTSSAFSPALTFTVPAGWEEAADTPTYLEIRPAGSEVAGIHLFRDPAAASQDLQCPQTPEAGVGGSSSELAAWIRDRPGLVVGDPKLASVGGLRGTEIDLAILDGWTASCPFADGAPTVPLFVGVKAEYRWVVAGSERLRLDLLDVPGGGTLVVDIDAFDGALMDDLLRVAAPIVGTFKFAGSG
jgi:hypothetical protein